MRAGNQHHDEKWKSKQFKQTVQISNGTCGFFLSGEANEAEAAGISLVITHDASAIRVDAVEARNKELKSRLQALWWFRIPRMWCEACHRQIRHHGSSHRDWLPVWRSCRKHFSGNIHSKQTRVRCWSSAWRRSCSRRRNWVRSANFMARPTKSFRPLYSWTIQAISISLELKLQHIPCHLAPQQRAWHSQPYRSLRIQIRGTCQDSWRPQQHSWK